MLFPQKRSSRKVRRIQLIECDMVGRQLKNKKLYENHFSSSILLSKVISM